MAEGTGSTPRRLWMVVAGLLVGAAIGYVLGQSADRSVSSSAILVSGAVSLDPNSDTALQSNQYVSQRMPTYAQLASTDVVTGPATEQLGLESGALGGAVLATAVPETSVVTIDVSGPSPQAAQDRNTAVTTALQAAIESTENTPASATEPVQNRVRLTVLSQASLPEAPTLSSTVILVLGAIIGLLLGIVVATALGRRDRAEQRRRSAYEQDTSSGRAPANGRSVPPPPAATRRAPSSGLAGRRDQP